MFTPRFSSFSRLLDFKVIESGNNTTISLLEEGFVVYAFFKEYTETNVASNYQM